MRRRIGFLLMCSATIPVAVFAATAWGCGALTTLQSSHSVAQPGQTITLQGRNFRGAGFSNVQIRLGGRTGNVLTTVTPAALAAGVPVQIPASTTPGWRIVAATQFSTSTGAPTPGSPARTTVRVQGDPVSSSAVPWGAAKPTGSGGSGSPDLPLPGILLSVALLAAGMALVARDRAKRTSRPALGA